MMGHVKSSAFKKSLKNVKEWEMMGFDTSEKLTSLTYEQVGKGQEETKRR